MKYKCLYHLFLWRNVPRLGYEAPADDCAYTLVSNGDEAWIVSYLYLSTAQ
jgi:hypothetical protein